MCTRFVLEQEKVRALLAALGIDGAEAGADRYNLAPGAEIGALRAGPGGPEVFRARWGFAAGAAGGLLANARAETLGARPAFREAFRRRRCVVPATGFYEWEKRGRARLPWLFRLRGDAPFGLAALWEDGGGGEVRVVVVTTAANALVARVHDRMPVLLATEAACRAWMERGADVAGLASLPAPVEAGGMTATPVSPRMNRAEHDGPECVVPAVHGLSARDGEEAAGQGLFF